MMGWRLVWARPISSGISVSSATFFSYSQELKVFPLLHECRQLASIQSIYTGNETYTSLPKVIEWSRQGRRPPRWRISGSWNISCRRISAGLIKFCIHFSVLTSAPFDRLFMCRIWLAVIPHIHNKASPTTEQIALVSKSLNVGMCYIYNV